MAGMVTAVDSRAEAKDFGEGKLWDQEAQATGMEERLDSELSHVGGWLS